MTHDNEENGGGGTIKIRLIRSATIVIREVEHDATMECRYSFV